MAFNDLEMIVATKGWLTSNFDMKNTGYASYVLRVKIHGIDLRGFSDSQETYLKNDYAQLETGINSSQKKNHRLNLSR